MRAPVVAALLVLWAGPRAEAAEVPRLVVQTDADSKAAVHSAATAAGFVPVAGDLGSGDAGPVATANLTAGSTHALALSCKVTAAGRVRSTRLHGAEASCTGVVYGQSGSRLEDDKMTRATVASSPEAALARARSETATALATRLLAAARPAARPSSPRAPDPGGLTVIVARMSSFRDLSAFATALAEASGDKGKPVAPELRRISAADVRYLARTSKTPRAVGSALEASAIAGLEVTVTAASERELTVVLSTETP